MKKTVYIHDIPYELRIFFDWTDLGYNKPNTTEITLEEAVLLEQYKTEKMRQYYYSQLPRNKEKS